MRRLNTISLAPEGRKGRSPEDSMSFWRPRRGRLREGSMSRGDPPVELSQRQRQRVRLDELIHEFPWVLMLPRRLRTIGGSYSFAGRIEVSGIRAIAILSDDPLMVYSGPVRTKTLTIYRPPTGQQEIPSEDLADCLARAMSNEH